MKNNTSNTHDGKFVSVAGDKLISNCTDGNKHHHTLAKDAKVTCDGKAGKLADLEAGTPIRLTTCKDDRNMVTAIECGKTAMAATL